MVCPYCTSGQGSPGTGCPVCGHRLPVYGGPQEFSFDRSSELYWKEEPTRTLWFNPTTGEYTVVQKEQAVSAAPPAAPADDWTPHVAAQAVPHDLTLDPVSGLYYKHDGGWLTSYDPQSGQYERAPAPEQPIVQTPEPEPAPEPAPAAATPAYGLPDGFVMDASAGLAYRTHIPAGTDGSVTDTTWFDPATGEYAQVRYAMVAAPAPAAAPVLPVAPTPPAAPTMEAAPMPPAAPTMAAAPPPPVFPAAIPSAPLPPVGQGTTASALPRKGVNKGVIIGIAAAVVVLGGALVWAFLWGPFAKTQTSSTSMTSSASTTLLSSVESSTSAAPLVWHDPALEGAVRIVLGKPQGEITQDDLSVFREIVITPERITLYTQSNNTPHDVEATLSTLQDLNKFTQLVAVVFDAVPALPDLSPLAELPDLWLLGFYGTGPDILGRLPQIDTLRMLHLWNCSLTSIEGIERFTALEEVLLGDNASLRDISPLAKLKELRYVDLVGTGVTDFSAVEHVEQVERNEASTYESNLDLGRMFADEGYSTDLLMNISLMEYEKLALIGGHLDNDMMFAYFESIFEDTVLLFDGVRTASGDDDNRIKGIETGIWRLFGADGVHAQELQEIFGPALVIEEAASGELIAMYAYVNGYVLQFYADSANDDYIQRFMLMHKEDFFDYRSQWQ